MSKKSKQTSTQTTNMVQTPTNPSWVDSGMQGLAGQITDLSKLDPYSLVAGPDALQTQAGQAAGGLTTSPNYDKASGILGGLGGSHITGQSLLDNLGSYMSPYTDGVVNTTLKGFDQNADRTRGQQMLDLANDSTFGGSGGSLLRSMTERELSDSRAQTEAGLRDTAFTRGTALSDADAARRQAAQIADGQQQLGVAQGLAGIGQAQGADQRGNIATQSAIGDILQKLAQVRAGAPINLLTAQTGLFAGLPLNLLHGQTSNGTQTGTGSVLEQGISGSDLGQMATAAAMAFASDRRLKRDIVKLGERKDGLGVYLYRYLWSPLQYIGVMAQEVLKVKPEAVITMPSGYLAVDYGAL